MVIGIPPMSSVDGTFQKRFQGSCCRGHKLEFDSVKVPLRRQGLGLSHKWLRLDAKTVARFEITTLNSTKLSCFRMGPAHQRSSRCAAGFEEYSAYRANVQRPRKTSTEEVKVIHTGREG
jgi:hypothetical protein